LLKDQLVKSETQLQNEKIRVEKAEKERDMYFSKVSRLQQEVDERTIDAQKLANQNHDHKRILDSREDELTRLKEQLKQTSRIKETILKKQKALDDVRMQTEMERDALRVKSTYNRAPILTLSMTWME
jgi:hypothetical protein